MITMYLVGWKKWGGSIWRAPGRELWKGKDSLIPGTPIHQLGDQAGQKGSFKGSEGGEKILCGRQNKAKNTDDLGHLTALPSLWYISDGACRGWVLKLRLQRSNHRTGVGCMETPWRSWECGPELGVYAGQSWGPHRSCMVNKHAEEEVGPHCRSLIFGMLAVGMALPPWALGACKHRRVVQHRSRAEIRADPQGPHDFGSRAEIWTLSGGFATSANLHLECLCKLSGGGTSEQITGTPVVEVGLEVVAVGIVGRDMWSQGQDDTVSPIVGTVVQLIMTMVGPSAWHK